ncbi:hypothetical protein N657DRAFT_260848 [Parathielavia appendiculata]|uniref:Uncharacterized protein n=1 Tax=Parathielavia appendiculata TaxID=2587402 RepID=A0AAN6Z0C1_9PEZI|nr:hypothetical protein N657DRAFT_260848 [Parathielavia appendiculata]
MRWLCPSTGFSDGPGSKSTSMNRYIIIFTVLTIFYLPLGFVTAVFSMGLLHEEELTGIKSQYATTMVVVSVVTYAVAIGLVMFVDRRRIKPLLTGLLAHFHLLGRQLRHPFEKEDSTGGPTAETDYGKEGREATFRRWAALWASSGLHRRQRRKRDKGKALEIPELGYSWTPSTEIRLLPPAPALRKAGRSRKSICRQGRTPSAATPNLPERI